jgi:hypothetical protein
MTLLLNLLFYMLILQLLLNDEPVSVLSARNSPSSRTESDLLRRMLAIDSVLVFLEYRVKYTGEKGECKRVETKTGVSSPLL